jgi:hypothetical protein
VNERMLVGTLGTASPLALAEGAVKAAEKLSVKTVACALHVDEHNRLWTKKVRGRPVNPHGWVATFNKKSCPDWLEEQIKEIEA